MLTSALTINCLFLVSPSVLGTSWGDSPVGYHWRVTVDNFCPDQTGPVAPWTHRCLLVLNEPREGALSRVWEKITATARLRRVVVVIHERPGGKRLSRTHYRRYSTNDVTCTELAIFPAGTICFDHAAGWNDYADTNGMSVNSNRASSRHSHTWTCDEDGHLVVLDTHCPVVLRRHVCIKQRCHGVVARVHRDIFLPPGRSREFLGGRYLYDQRRDFDPRHLGARPAASCAQAQLTACTRVSFLVSDSGGNTQVYDGDGHG